MRANRFALLLGALMVLAFPDVVLGWRTFYVRDFALFGYPLAHHYQTSLLQGEIPLWNPLSNCGLPFLAQWNTMVLYPPSLIHLALPLSWSLGLFCLGHQFLAGMGAYFLARRWTGNHWAAAVAGLAFAFNGLTLSCLKWPNNIAALGWMPWVVFAAESGWRQGGRRVIVAGLAGALQMLTGAPEIIVFTWLMVGVLWLLDSLTRVPLARSGELVFAANISGALPRRRYVQAGIFNLRASCLSARRLGLIILIVAGLAAAQLLPFLHLLAQSQRNPGFSDSSWAMPWWGWANFLVPLFRCFRSHQGVFAQFGQYWTSSYYAGVGVVALALWAAWRERERRVWLLCAVAVGSLVLALGDDGLLYRAVRQLLPQSGWMRFPIKFVVIAAFVLPLLAAYGARRLCPRQNTTPATNQSTDAAVPSAAAQPLSSEGSLSKDARAADAPWRSWLIIASGMLVLICVIVWVAHAYPLPTDHSSATLNNALARSAFLALLAASGFALCRVREPQYQRLLSLGLLLLLWADLMTHAPNLNPTVERWVYAPDSPALGLLTLTPRPRLGESRAMISPAAEYRIDHLALTNAAQDVLVGRKALFCNANLLDAIPKVDGFFSLYPHYENQVRSLLYASTNADVPRLADFLGVAHVTAPGAIMEWASRTNWLPLITAGQRPVYVDEPTTIRGLIDPAFDPRRVVYLPLEAQRQVQVERATAVNIRSQHVTAHRLEWDMQADQPSLVVLAQAWYPHWKATVDGRAVPLWRANHAFQALQIPAGRSHVELVYRDPLFRWGSVISLGTVLACIVVGVVTRSGRIQNGMPVCQFPFP